jgi:hypothetical protein
MIPSWMSDWDWQALGEPWFVGAAGVAASLFAFVLGARLIGGRKPVVAVEETNLADRYKDKGPGERRTVYRRRGNCVDLLIAELSDSAEPREGWVVDRSVSGIGVWSDREFASGTVLRIRPEHAPQMAPWVEVEVRSCKEFECGWQLGCSFVKTPPYSVLLLFG